MTTLGFIGGTGPEGRGLALRFAAAGYRVLLGSRDADRARKAAQNVAQRLPGLDITGVVNDEAAQQSDIVLLTLPYVGQRPTLEMLGAHLREKIVIDVVAPVIFEDGVPRAVAVSDGSAAQEAQRLLPDSLMVAAFQNISAADLLKPDRSIEGDVIVCSDHTAAKRQVMELAQLIKTSGPWMEAPWRTPGTWRS